MSQVHVPFTLQINVSIDFLTVSSQRLMVWWTPRHSPVCSLALRPWALFKVHHEKGPNQFWRWSVLQGYQSSSSYKRWKNTHPPTWSHLMIDAEKGCTISSGLSRAPDNHSLSHTVILDTNKYAKAGLSKFVLVKSVLNGVFLLIAN